MADKTGKISSSKIQKVFDPVSKKELKVTFNDVDELSAILAGKDGEAKTVDYDYLNTASVFNSKSVANNTAINSMLVEIAGLTVEKDEKDQEYKETLSKADIDAALKDDKDYTINQVYSSSLRDRGFSLTNKKTGESIIIPKSLTDSIPQESFNKDDELDVYKIISSAASGSTDTEEITKLKEKFGIKYVDINKEDNIVTFKYNDEKKKDSLLPLSIKDKFIEKNYYKNRLFLNIPKEVKVALWNELSAESKDKNYITSQETSDIMGCVSKDANVYIDKIKSEIPDATPEQIAKLMKTGNEKVSGKSYYDTNSCFATEKDTKKARLDDYIKLVKNVPNSVKNKGTEAVQEYRNGVLSILETCDEYGAMYIKNMPDPENMAKHAEGLKRLSAAAEKTQGCKFTNATLFNGFTAEELEKKVIIPNEKLAAGEKVGTEGHTLVMITHELGADYNQAFKNQFESNYMNSKNYNIEGKACKFDQSFLDYYDSILVIQPNDQSADDTLNKGFASINKGLDKKAQVDMTFIAHSGGGQPFLSLPKDKYADIVYNDNLHYGERLHSTMMDNSDFASSGQSFSKDMQEIFAKSIANGYNPRFIGQGCTSEFMQKTFNNYMPEEIAQKVRVFGSMGSSIGQFGIGYVNDEKGIPRLEYTTKQEILSYNKEGKQEFNIDGTEKTKIIYGTEKEISPDAAIKTAKDGTSYITNNGGLYEGGAANALIASNLSNGTGKGRLMKYYNKENPGTAVLFDYNT